MLIQSHSGGANGYYGFGAELGALTQTKDFNCNQSICYAVGKENDALFKKLQMNINVFSGRVGFKPLVVDGFIGAATVAALQALVKIGLQSPPSTKEQAAANAPLLVDVLAKMAQIQTATPGAPALSPPGAPVTFKPPAPTPTPTIAPTISPAQLPGAAPAATVLPKPKSKTLYWILGGLAAVLAVGGVGYVVYRRKARS